MADRSSSEFPWRVLSYAALVLLGLASFGFRFWFEGRYAAPSSADHGLYLSKAGLLFGQDVSGFGAVFPPVFFVLLLGVQQFAEPVVAVRLLATVVAAFVPLPFFLIASRYAAKPWAFAATVLFVFAEGYSEMTGWGGGPDFLGIAFMLASILFLLRHLDRPNRRDLLLASLLGSLVVGTHHLTAAVYLVAAVAWAALEVLRARSVRAFHPFGVFAGLTGLLSLPYVPAYLSLGSLLAPPLTPFWPDALGGVAFSIQFLTRDSVLLWIPVSFLSVIGGVAVLRGRREGTMYAGFALTNVLLSLTFIRDNPTRPLYYLYFPLVGCFPAFLGWAFARIPRELPRPTARIVQALLVAFVVSTSVTMVRQSLGRMSNAVDWYHAVDTQELEALYWLRDNTPPNAVVATAGLPFFTFPEGTRYGWWIEGLAKRKAFYGGSEVFAVLAEERLMVQDANRFFAGNYVLSSDTIRIAENHPGSKGNPEISIRTGRAFLPIAYLDDGFIEISLDTGASVERLTLYPAPNGTVVVTQVPAPRIETTRALANLSVARTETIAGNEVAIGFRLSSRHPIRDVTIPIWIGWGFRFASSSAIGSRVLGLLTDERETEMRIAFDLSSNGTVTIVSNATNADPVFGAPQASFRVLPASNVWDLSMVVRITILDAPDVGTAAMATDALAIAAVYRMSHVFQSKKLFFMYLRFAEDDVHFEPIYENLGVAIFRLK